MTGGSTHGVVWSGGQSTDLGTLPDDVNSTGSGINNAGDIVGLS
jgi:uncharacterized membrane protein